MKLHVIVWTAMLSAVGAQDPRYFFLPIASAFGS